MKKKKRQIKKPKGMRSGLCIFVVFSILGVIFPLICALMNSTYKYDNLCMPIVSLIFFGGCIFITFVYLALLLRWKNVDMEVTRHESNSPEGKL